MNTPDRRALLVLGMHRSGTSALTRVLNLLGVELGGDLLPAHRDNQAGFWEHRGIVLLHDELLAAVGSSWSDPRPIPAQVLASDVVAPFRERLAEIVQRDFGSTSHFGVKDPRLCRLLPLWLPLLDELGVHVDCALVGRHPDEVAASLHRRDALPDDTARLLWLTHTLDAERESRGRSRAVVTYEGLLHDWRSEVRRLAAAFSLDWEEAITQVEGEVDTFLDGSLRHHTAPDADPAGGAWIERTWEAVRSGAQGEIERAGAAMDRVARELDVAGALFFPATGRVEELRQKLEKRSRQYLELRRDVEELREFVGGGEDAAEPDTLKDVVTEAEGIRTDAREATRPRAGDAALARPGTSIVRTYERPEGDPRVSIVIPLFNQVELTAKCLESLADHTDDGTFEVILVDNGSTDGTPELLRCLEGNVKIVRNDENLGFATACNQGAALASAENVLLLNNDIEAQEGWLPPLLEVLDRDPSVGVVGSKLLFPTGEIQHAGVALLARPDGAFPLGAFHVHYGEDAEGPEVSTPMRFQVVTGACLLVRRQLFEDAGGLDTYYWNGCEDVDFCLKIGTRGWGVVYEPRSVLVHHESKSGPERFSRTRSNEDLLASRWFGKVEPDLIENADGSRKLAEETPIGPYEWPVGVGEAGGAAERAATGEAEAAAAPTAPDALTSIVILTRNGLEDTKLCLESIHRHTPEPHEVIVVDNGSTDGTVGYLRERGREHGNLRVVANAGNRGFAAGNNLGLSIAHGRTFCLLNNDTVVTEGWLSGLRGVLHANPGCGLVGPMTNYASGPQHVVDVPYRTLQDMESYAMEWACNHSGSTPSPRIVGFCALVRREVVEAVGGLDERFGSGNFEDDDYCIRAAQAGWSAHVANAVFIHHTGSRTFASEGIDYTEAMLANFEIFRDKWGLGPDAPVDQPYPFGRLVAGPPQPRIALPDLSATHELLHQGRWHLDRHVPAEARAASGAGANGQAPEPGREPDAVTGALDTATYRLAVGLVPGDEPTAEVRALFARYGFQEDPPVWDAAALAEQLRTKPLVLLLGPDVVVPDDALKELVTVMKNSDDIAAAGPQSNAAPDPQRAKPGYRGLGRDLRRFAARRRRRRQGRTQEAPYLGSFCLLLKSSLVRRAGGIDETRDLPDALLDLFGRIRDGGDRVVVASGAWVHHARLTAEEGATYGQPALATIEENA